MTGKKILLLGVFLQSTLLGGPYIGGLPESMAIQEMRLSLEQLDYRLHSHTVEIDLFQERIQKLEQNITALNREIKTAATDKTLERRFSSLEKAHETLIADVKLLKTHINETNTALAQCQNKLTGIDKQLSSDIQSLKASMNSMLALLQSPPAEEKLYIVQSGDSLGQIALNHKTDIKTLKRINDLSTDMIYVGQRIILP